MANLGECFPKKDNIVENKIEKWWDLFRDLVISPGTPEAQLTATKAAFYAGAQSAFNELVRASEEENEVEAHSTIYKIQEEFEEYAAEILKNKNKH